MSLFPWAQFRRRKSAVKLHTLLGLRSSIPSVVIVTGDRSTKSTILDQLIWEPGAIYLMDRGYLDFRRLYRIQLSGAFFVTRAKKRFDCRRLYSQAIDRRRVCNAIRSWCSTIPCRNEATPNDCAGCATSMARVKNVWCFSPTTSSCRL
jgi:Transposase DDE domain